jgi:sugar phosphate isomerase/epimerase
MFTLISSGIAFHSASGQEKFGRPGKSKLKISLNAYSFNDYFRDGRMDLGGLLEFCARYDFDAVDPTGYYFPNYPEVPSDEYINHIKRKAFLLGLDISGTGVRNNFTDPDSGNRAADVAHIKEWIEVAAQLGAPVIRVFAGRGIPEGYSRAEMNGWIAEALKQCVEYGEQFGVMIGVQNHNDYLKTSDHVLDILRMVNSEWMGIVLDVGSFSTEDPYADIARIAPYAISWQIKEYLGYDDRDVNINLKKLNRIFTASGYRGYIPLETLDGDPMMRVPEFLKRVRNTINV